MTIAERPSIEESVNRAANSSDLTLRAERRGAVDVLIAAGMNHQRLGGALLRLHSEYDGASRARPTTAADFLAAQLPADKAHRVAARAQAAAASSAHNLHESGLLLGRLKSLPAVRQALVEQLRKWGEDQPEDVCAAVLRWWLQPTCTCCNGQRFEVVAGTGRLSNRVCKACRGSGQLAVPAAQMGRRLANHIDMCLDQARRSIGRRLRQDWPGAAERTKPQGAANAL